MTTGRRELAPRRQAIFGSSGIRVSRQEPNGPGPTRVDHSQWSGTWAERDRFGVNPERRLIRDGHHLDDHHRVYRGRDREIHHARRQRTSGFMLTTILGIVGAFVATYLGQAIGGIAPTKVPA